MQQYYGFKLPESIQTFVTGAVAGSVSSLTTYPFDLLRTRFAAQGNGNKRIFTSLPQAIGIIYKAEGVSGFFKGVKPAVFAITPYMGLFFTSYEAMRRLFDNYPILPGTFSEPVSSIIATIVGKGVIFPLDVVRRRLQVQGIYRQYYLQEIPKYPSSIIQCLKQIIVYEGIRGLYKGFLVAIIKSAPARFVEHLLGNIFNKNTNISFFKVRFLFGFMKSPFECFKHINVMIRLYDVKIYNFQPTYY